MPFLYDAATNQKDALCDLYLPFGTGALLFVTTLVYSIIECVRLEGMSRRDNG